MNKLICGDNIEILKDFPDECIDLCYADPPFNTGKDWGAFNDKWEGGLKGYLKFMKARCIEIHRVLKSTGSFYLHCDPTASHYLKVMMDSLFGIDNFRNEIVWKRDASGKGAKRVSRQYPRVQDIILLYSKTDKHYFLQTYKPLSEEQAKTYRYKDQETERRFKAVQLGNYSQASIEKMNKEGLIHTSKSGKQYKKYYLDEAQATVDAIWMDIPGFGVRTNAKERTGYPTQKPLKLLERIIKASSNEGDVVLDPFCGSGTTCVAADKLNRKYIGIDENPDAIRITEERLNLQQLKLFE